MASKNCLDIAGFETDDGSPETIRHSESFHGDQKLRYDSYVRWIGGFIEDLHINDYKGEDWLYYEPWIESMLDTHCTWFIEHMHYYEHTDVFYQRLSDIKNKKPIEAFDAPDSCFPADAQKTH